MQNGVIQGKCARADSPSALWATAGAVLEWRFFPRDAIDTETLVRHKHERGPFESSAAQLALEQAERDLFLPARLMNLLLPNLTTAVE